MISLIVIYFILFSVLGWVFECSYAMLRTGHWENRGFLYGPVCPIYGVGAMLAILLFGMIPEKTGLHLNLPQIFAVSFFGSATLELITSLALEYFFHAVWWDYSNMPLNYKGRICFPASTLFGISGILIVKIVIPVLALLPVQQHPEANEAAAILLMFLFGADIALTLASLTELVERMEALQAELDRRAEAGVVMVSQAPRAAMETVGSAAVIIRKTAAEKAVAARKTVGTARRTAIDTTRRTTQKIMDMADFTAIGARDSASDIADDIRDEEQEWNEQIRSLFRHLTARQKYHLGSVASFRSRGTKAVAEKLRKLMNAQNAAADRNHETEDF
jgi:uncharacterized membrane protein